MRNLFCWLFLLGCAGFSQASELPVADPIAQQDPADEAQWHFQQWLPSQLDWLAQQQCQDPSCDKVPVSFNQGQFEPETTRADQTILILDTDGMDFMATLPYRHRVRAYLEFDAALGYFAGRQPEVEVPAYLQQLYQRLTQFRHSNAANKFTPAAWLAPLQKQINRLSPYAALPYTGHGSIALGYLAEHNPEAEFVLTLLPDFASLYRTEFCAADIASFRDKISQASAHFRQQVLMQYGVEWINFSAGFDLQRTIQMSAQRLCQTPLTWQQQQQLLQAFQPFYQMLFTHPTALAVQAGVVNYSSDQHALDVLPFAHRIRAGFYNTGTQLSSLMPDGQPKAGQALPVLPGYQANSLAVLDVLINFSFRGVGSRCVSGRYSYMIPTDFGMAYEALCSQQTSWAAPLVLSRLIELKVGQFPYLSAGPQLFTELKHLLTPQLCQQNEPAGLQPCKLQDPLQYQQHQVFSMGFLQL